jgi:hypothetical protein
LFSSFHYILQLTCTMPVIHISVYGIVYIRGGGGCAVLILFLNPYLWRKLKVAIFCVVCVESIRKCKAASLIFSS